MQFCLSAIFNGCTPCAAIMLKSDLFTTNTHRNLGHMGFIKHFYQSNRHLKLAIILAPLLAIGAYVITGIYLDRKIAEHPGSAQALHLQPGCRLLSNVCELLHREIAINIALESDADGKQWFYLSSSTPISGALVSFENRQPLPLLSRGDARKWVVETRQPVQPKSMAQLAVTTPKNRFFAEIPIIH